MSVTHDPTLEPTVFADDAVLLERRLERERRARELQLRWEAEARLSVDGEHASHEPTLWEPRP